MLGMTFILMGSPGLGIAANGDLDPTFGLNGRQVINSGPGADLAWGIDSLPDGRIVMGGQASENCAVSMLFPDGSIDTSFGVAGVLQLDFDNSNDTDESCYDLVIQPDGKIIIVGDFDNGSNIDIMAIRINTNGTLDTSFSGDGYAFVDFGLSTDSKDLGRGVALQADGKIVISGSVETSDDNVDVGLVRLNSDGSRDTSFDGDGRVTLAIDLYESTSDFAFAVKIQPDGKIIIAGWAVADSVNNTRDMLVARFTSTGDPDPGFNFVGYRVISFNLGGNNDDAAADLVILDNGTIVIGGFAREVSGYDFAAAAVTSIGQMDTQFSNNGLLVVPFDLGLTNDDIGFGMEKDSHDRVILTGYISNNESIDFGVIRFLADGTLDNSFGQLGKVVIPFDIQSGNIDQGLDAHILPNDSILISGAIGVNHATEDYDFGVAKLLGDIIFVDGFDN